MTRERLAAGKKLQLILVAGVGSDHIDLEAAAAAGLTVAECTGARCNWRSLNHVLQGLETSEKCLVCKAGTPADVSSGCKGAGASF